MSAAAPSTASDPEPAGPNGPILTCVGCRTRASAAELLRVVSGLDGTVVPDPRRSSPGRGAWVHPDTGCVDLAVRRRAFARALRMPGSVDPAAVCEYVAQAGPGTTAPSGTPQEMTSYGHSMKRQR